MIAAFINPHGAKPGVRKFAYAGFDMKRLDVNLANTGKGIVAGFIATMVLSALMLMNQAMGIMPQLNPVDMITRMMGAQTPIVG